MFVCAGCGRKYSHVPVLPLMCSCGAKGEPRQPVNAWQVIHLRYAAAIQSGEWSETVERHWLTTEFRPLVPCLACSGKWLEIEPLLDLSTPDAAFRSSWELHNKVSTEHVQPAKQAISFERCKALYLPQPTMNDCCVAVTSLSLLPNHLQVQERCLNSWERAGFSIHAKNRSQELDRLKELYPQVSQWHVCDKVPTEYATRTQSIHALAQTAVELGQRVMLINSDIEIHGEQQIIREAVESGIMVGIRHDYEQDWWTGSRFIWGLDAFTFTPDQARALPYRPYAIGKPVWDYWLPQFFRSIGQRMNFVGEPLFFHKLHETNWNYDEWMMAAGWFADEFGFMRTQQESVAFRKSLPFPPGG